MRLLLSCAIVVLASSSQLLAEERGGVIQGVVVGEGERPVVGTTVILTGFADPGKQAVVAVTDSAGAFRFHGLPAGSYSVVAVFGDHRSVTKDIRVGADEVVTIRPTLLIRPEVITIEEPLSPTTLPKLISSSVSRRLPWSDEAITSNRWAVGWLLLDIDSRGQIERFRFLHRPGHGLDEIAEKEAWKLRFEPARDAGGRPVASQLLWKMEWPSYWWLLEVERDSSLHQFLKLTRASRLPPCRGDGPLNMGSRHPTYRDCSPPDLETGTIEPPITRPK